MRLMRRSQGFVASRFLTRWFVNHQFFEFDSLPKLVTQNNNNLVSFEKLFWEKLIRQFTERSQKHKRRAIGTWNKIYWTRELVKEVHMRAALETKCYLEPRRHDINHNGWSCQQYFLPRAAQLPSKTGKIVFLFAKIYSCCWMLLPSGA